MIKNGTRTKRLKITERGRPDQELVSVTDEAGNKRDVWVSKDELKKSAERADKDFDRAIAAVTAGEDIDPKAFGELLTSHKEAIMKLAEKEADVKGAVYKVMEDALVAYKEYERVVDKAVRDSGYTGAAAEGLRASLMEQRGSVFAQAFSETTGARAKRTLENAVRGKALAESARQVANLAETAGKKLTKEPVGTAEEEAADELVAPLSLRELDEEQARLIRSYAEALDKADDLHAKMTKIIRENKKMEKGGKIDSDEWEARVTEEEDARDQWAAATQKAKRIAGLMEKAGIDRTQPEFATRKARAELIKALPEPVEYVGGYRVAKPDSMEIIDEEGDDTDQLDMVEIADLTSEIRQGIVQLQDLEKQEGREAEASALDRELQEKAAEWALGYLSKTDDEIMEEAEKIGIAEFLTKKDIQRLRKGHKVKQLFMREGPTEAQRAARERAERALPLSVAEATDLPEGTPTGEWDDDEDRTVRKTLVPPVTERLVEEKPAKPGFMQRMANSKLGRFLTLAGLAFGIGKGAAEFGSRRGEDAPPEREQSALIEAEDVTTHPEGKNGPVTEEIKVEQDKTLLKEKPASKADHAEPIYPKGDPRNLRRALKIVSDAGFKGRGELAKERLDNMRTVLSILEESGLPTTAEYNKMKAEERREELRVALERLQIMREISRMDSPALTAMKRAELQEKIDQHQAFVELMKGLDEAMGME